MNYVLGIVFCLSGVMIFFDTQDMIPALRYREFQKFLENINIRDLDEIVLESMIPEEIPEYLRDGFWYKRYYIQLTLQW